VRVSGAGTGGGIVASRDAAVKVGCRITQTTAVDVDGTCVSNFADGGAGGSFTLTAYPDETSVFDGWDGCSEVAGPVCTLSFSQGVGSKTFSVTARFRSTLGVATGYGVNLLLNPGFEQSVVVGGLPTQTGRWQGDSAASVASTVAVSAHDGARALRFITTGPAGASAEGVSSQQWQIVDVSSYAVDIDAGRVNVEGEAWFRVVEGDASTDHRFDLRILAFSGTPSQFPASYAAPAGVRLADHLSTLMPRAGAWTRAQRSYPLPVGTRYLVVEIYAYENVVNDATFPEFAGHYADDVSLVLRRAP
jgi:hypothetical protein